MSLFVYFKHIKCLIKHSFGQLIKNKFPMCIITARKCTIVLGRRAGMLCVME